MNVPKRNETCPCGSGKKYKKCCLGKTIATRPPAPAANAQLQMAMLHYNRGKALEAQGRPEEAVTCYRRALELKPDDIDVLNDLGITLFDQGRLDEAVTCYRRALVLKPDDAEILNNLGLALFDQGRLDAAIDSLRMALALKPHFNAASCNLGKAYLRRGNHAEGLALIARETGIIRFDSAAGIKLLPEVANAKN